MSDIVDDNRTVGIPVVHRGQGLVSLLARRVPYFKLDCRALVERDGLCEEGGTDGRFPVVIKLILFGVNSDHRLEMAASNISQVNGHPDSL